MTDLDTLLADMERRARVALSSDGSDMEWLSAAGETAENAVRLIEAVRCAMNGASDLSASIYFPMRDEVLRLLRGDAP